MFCVYCAEQTVDAGVGEYQCSQGAMLSRHIVQRLLALLAEPRTTSSAMIPAGSDSPSSPTWFCPRCGLQMYSVRGGVSCPGCFVDIGALLYELVEFNPHVPNPTVPDEVRSAIELHDSRLVSVEEDGLVLVAYVHRWRLKNRTWSGTGWSQDFRIGIRSKSLPTPPPLPVDIGSGTLVVAGTAHENLIPYPLPKLGKAELVLHLVPTHTIELRGELVSVSAVGHARLVETLPADFAPLDGAG
jgi:hypothetical protein